MPFWRYRRSWRYRPRRRWFRTRFTRRPFQRRYWRRRRRTVRKRKLKKIRLQQWQPQFIRKLKIVGYEPLFITTSERRTNNFTCYKDSIAPHLFPGGGGFSISNFTLRGLYLKHNVLENWWTVSNDNMPLIRYCGCKLYLYRQSECDYMFLYNRQPPMTATRLTYTSSHPQAMLLHKNSKKILCKKSNKNKRNYKKLYVKPPTQMQNKWYFQKDLADMPILQTVATAASLDRMFLSSNGISTTVGFTSLDVTGMQNHNYTKEGTIGWTPQPNLLLFGIRRFTTLQATNITDLIYLGNTETLTDGTAIGSAPGSTIKDQIQAVQANNKHWGNPFDPEWHITGKILQTNKTFNEIAEHYKQYPNNKKLPETWFVIKTTFSFECRYSPQADKGINNKIYLIDLNDKTHSLDWTSASAAPNSLYTNLPIWLLLWGYLDFNRKCGEFSTIDTRYICVIYSEYLEPKDKRYFVPLDLDFLEGRSPYAEQGIIYPSDLQHWHPRIRTQVRSLNMLGSTGPGVIKLPEGTSQEAHMKYVFNFKIGGSPPPMATLTDPDKQPKYATPDNILETNSLQSPGTPIEYYLYNFDERRGQITKRAIQRMQKHQETEQTIFPITETATACPIPSKKTTQTPTDSSDEEEKETSLEEQLLLQRKQQSKLRKRINILLNRLAQFE
uniref:Capsid protein n=1 Tax=Betatorquevirus homini27 TaxID=3052014 RepID=A0AAU8H4M0_9VIRU